MKKQWEKPKLNYMLKNAEPVLFKTPVSWKNKNKEKGGTAPH